MNELTVIENRALAAPAELKEELFYRWTSYIDASTKTVETYSKAI